MQQNGYKKQAEYYLRNAEKMLHLGKFAKASEFYWGATAQAVKAVAFVDGKELRMHRDIEEYADKIADERKDNTIRIRFEYAAGLHRNFYENNRSPKAVKFYAKETKLLVRQLLKNHKSNNGNHK